MSNKLNFDYNNIRKLTSNLKNNLKDKYKSLENITSGINNTDGTGYQYSSLQVSESDKYIDELTQLFDNNTLDGNYNINGVLSVNTIETDNIIIRNRNDKYLVENIDNVNKILDIIKSQDLKLSKQTINNSELNNITVNSSKIYSSIINDSIINRCTINNIRNINGKVGINNSNPIYDLDIVGSSRFGLDSSGISHIEFGIAQLSSGSVIINTNNMSTNCRYLLTYQSPTASPGILSASRTTDTTFTISSSSGTDSSYVFWTLIE
jgi:hypothetical protein